MILAGFGTQVTLFVELRHRQRLNAAMTTTAGTGALRIAINALGVYLAARRLRHTPVPVPVGVE